MNLLKSAVQYELDTFFAALQGHELPDQEITRSAFSQARKKLNPAAFVELNAQAVQAFYDGAPIRLWHGLRILAVDGSTLRLPDTKAIRQSFPSPDGEVPQGRLVELYDVLNGVLLDARFSELEIGEGFHAEQLVALSGPGDVVIYDRNFPSFPLMALHEQVGSAYCMRTTLTQFKAVAQFVERGQTETWVDIAPSSGAKRACRHLDLASTPLRVRLVRVELPTGEIEVLMTNLGDEMPATDFAALYQLRWGVEEAFKWQKCRGELENFTGRTTLSVSQDIFAKLFAMNLAAMCIFAAEEVVPQVTAQRRYEYRINRATALSKMKHHLVCAILNGTERLDDWLRWLSQDLVPVRPDRQFERKSPGRKKPGYHQNYKRSG